MAEGLQLIVLWCGQPVYPTYNVGTPIMPPSQVATCRAKLLTCVTAASNDTKKAECFK